MPNFTKDLSTWYPLLPKNVLPGCMGGIRGIHILCVIPISDVSGLAISMPNTSWIRCYLADSSTAILDIAGQQTYTIPLSIVHSVDTPVTYSKMNAYIVIDSGTSKGDIDAYIQRYESSLGKFYIHPDCIEVYTEAPTLQLIGSNRLDISDSTNDNEYQQDQEFDQTIDIIPQDSVNICDGYNCAIDTSYNLLSFTGGENFGAGIMWKVNPDLFTKDGEVVSLEDFNIDNEIGCFMHPAGEGVCSINGLSDDVVIKGMGDAIVATAYEGATPAADEQYQDVTRSQSYSHTITITVSERPNADDDDGTPDV